MISTQPDDNNTMEVQDLIKKFNLEPLPGEGGFFRQTWCSDYGTAIYYLLSQKENGFSALHKLTHTEIYHFYVGDPVDLVVFPPDKTPYVLSLGDFTKGKNVPQCIVPAGSIHGSCLRKGGSWALLGTTMAPGFSPDSFDLMKRDEMLKMYPEYYDWIIKLTREDVTS